MYIYIYIYKRKTDVQRQRAASIIRNLIRCSGSRTPQGDDGCCCWGCSAACSRRGGPS